VMALSNLGGHAPYTPRVPFCDSGMSPTISANADLAGLATTDPHMAAKIARKREQAAARAARMCSPRLSRIGCDVVALNAQVVLKKAAIAEEADGDQFETRKMQLTDMILNVREEQRQTKARQKQQECVAYSLNHLRKDQRREYFLFNDPDELKKDRVPGVDSSKSSCQYFESEVAMAPEVVRDKKRQSQEWLLAQMAEKNLQDQAHRQADLRFEQWESDANQVRTLCENAENTERSEAVRSNAEENLRLAAERTSKRQAAIDRRAREEKRHVDQEMERVLERERHEYSLSSNGRKRDVKRCTKEEEQRTLDINAEQVLYKKQHEHDEDWQEERHMKNCKITEAIQTMMEDRSTDKRLTRRKDQDKDNLLMASVKRSADRRDRQDYLSAKAAW